MQCLKTLLINNKNMESLLLQNNLEELRLNNPLTEKKVKEAIQIFIKSNNESLTLNVNPYNAEQIRKWAEQNGFSTEIVRRYNNGTVDIVLRKQKNTININEIEQVVSSLSSTKAVKDSVRNKLQMLEAGKLDRVTINLNPRNAAILQEWATRNNYKFTTRQRSDGTVDLEIYRINPFPLPQYQNSNQSKSKTLTMVKSLDDNFYTSIRYTFEALKAVHGNNQKLLSFYNSLTEEEKGLFLSFLWGKYLLKSNIKSDPELWDKNLRREMSTFLSQQSLDNLIQEFTDKLQRSKKQMETIMDILKSKAEKRNINLEQFLGAENLKEFQRGLTYFLFEWNIDILENLIASMDFDRVIKIYNTLKNLKFEQNRHSPNRTVSDQDLATIALSVTFFEKLFGVDSRLALAIIGQESNFNKKARNAGNLGLTQQSKQGWNLYLANPNYNEKIERYLENRLGRVGIKTNNIEFLSPAISRAMMKENIFAQVYTGYITIVGKAIEKYGEKVDLRNLVDKKGYVYTIAFSYNGHPLHQSGYARSVQNSVFWRYNW